MTAIKDIGNHPDTVPLRLGGAAQKGREDFSTTIRKFIDEANQLQREADLAVRDLATGKLENVHQAVISMEKAEVSFRLMVEARNRIVRAYEEVMKLQA